MTSAPPRLVGTFKGFFQSARLVLNKKPEKKGRKELKKVTKKKEKKKKKRKKRKEKKRKKRSSSSLRLLTLLSRHGSLRLKILIFFPRPSSLLLRTLLFTPSTSNSPYSSFLCETLPIFQLATLSTILFYRELSASIHLLPSNPSPFS